MGQRLRAEVKPTTTQNKREEKSVELNRRNEKGKKYINNKSDYEINVGVSRIVVIFFMLCDEIWDEEKRRNYYLPRIRYSGMQV